MARYIGVLGIVISEEGFGYCIICTVNVEVSPGSHDLVFALI